jgi:signal transduction histidine kinase
MFDLGMVFFAPPMSGLQAPGKVAAAVRSDKDGSWRDGVGKPGEWPRWSAGLRARRGAAILSRMQPLLVTIARRPLTRDCWRETLYLILEFVTGTIGFTFIITGASIAFGLSILIIGLPIAVLLAHFNRWWCGIDRALAALVLHDRIPARYREPIGSGRISRWLSVFGDRQTWLDALWMLVAFPLGIVGFVVAVSAWATVLGLLTGPIWAWSIPGWIHSHVVTNSILAPFLCVPAAIAAAWIVRGLALAQAGLASWLLGPNRTEVLEQRVETLSETRAGAVDAAHSELQRVERDLHDGAQARLVALAMDLGLAEQRLTNADPETALEHVSSARGQARAAMAELRDLVRGIGPSILQDRGLDAALTALVTGRNPPVDLRVELRSGEVTARETAAYFVVAEALANARKHASPSRISVRAWDDAADRLIVEVVDDGVGGANPDAGSGLSGLGKRVAALDGMLTVVSPAGGPTTVRAELPCAS